APVKVVPPELSAKVIDCTGQVLKVRMGLVGPPPSEPLVLLIEADSAVIPGTFAVTSAWPFTTPLIPVSSLTVATCEAVVDQVKGPTSALISVPLLFAIAW